MSLRDAADVRNWVAPPADVACARRKVPASETDARACPVRTPHSCGERDRESRSCCGLLLAADRFRRRTAAPGQLGYLPDERACGHDRPGCVKLELDSTREP